MNFDEIFLIDPVCHINVGLAPAVVSASVGPTTVVSVVGVPPNLAQVIAAAAAVAVAANTANQALIANQPAATTCCYSPNKIPPQ